MKPGRELDALVAEKVMGWRAGRDAEPDDPFHATGASVGWMRYDHDQDRWVWAGYWANKPKVYMNESGELVPSSVSLWQGARFFEPSARLDDAWRVVAAMQQHDDPRKQTLRLVAYPYARTYATFNLDAEEHEWCEGNGEYATPLAICLAALEAVAITEAVP